MSFWLLTCYVASPRGGGRWRWGKPSSMALASSSQGLLLGNELDVEPAEVVLKLGEAAGSYDGRGDGRIEQRPGERDS